MLAFLTSILIAFAEGGSQGGGSMEFWYKNIDPWLNYPGFEAWRFINLGIFLAIIIYLVKKPLTEGFKKKREEIRAELIRAEEEKAAAAARLESVEAKLAGLSREKLEVIEEAKAEAAAERRRIEEAAENDIRRVEEQAKTEISRKTAQVNVQLRRYSAMESVRLAEEKIRGSMTAATDAELVRSNIESIGGVNKA